jgi:Ca2+-transporting ATPase
VPGDILPVAMNTEWHRRSIEQVAAELGVTLEAGLDPAEAQRRLREHGPNELQEKPRTSPLRLLAQQFLSTMVLILIVAAGLSAVLGKVVEAAAILAIVLMFAVLGYVQESRAERAIAALRNLAVPSVRVRRRSVVEEVPARELVAGDVVLLEAGNIVPADLRLAQTASLRIQEAALTGESEAVEKDPGGLDLENLALGDRRNMAYLGTVVAHGRGAGLVTSTGMGTELGQIAALIQQVPDTQTPLQRKLDRLGRLLALCGAAAAGLVLLIGLIVREPVLDMVLTALSVAVAVVPEGLPAVVTITLSIGAQRMLRRKALIRRLPAVETLGSVTVICSDKTGTLTENRMTVKVVDVAGHVLQLSEELRRRRPSLPSSPAAPIDLATQPAQIALVLASGVLCNDAVLRRKAEQLTALGDPTEGALLIAGAEAGMLQEELARLFPRIGEVPFDSGRKRMTTVHTIAASGEALPYGLRLLGTTPEGRMSATKGSVDGLLEVSTRVWGNAGPEPMDEEWRRRILAANDSLAKQGMRVLGLALGQPPAGSTPEELERDLVFVGLVGMIDPPRIEAREAVSTCREAGIRPVMITGDHPLTAEAVARELGLPGGARTLTGREIAGMAEGDLDALAPSVTVYARVSPEHKLRIVEALQRRGEVVAMTGDGVNDSPALRQADIGVAMGITGTDAAKEASDMVLLDDNFATIVAAVEEGRTIFANLLRFVKFSVGGNLAKVLVMLAAPFAGLGVALLPLQLLWLNLLTDGLMGLALGVEPAEGTLMRRPPRSPRASLFAGGAGIHMLWIGLLISALTLLAGYVFRGSPELRAVMFTTLAFTQIAHALGLRALRDRGAAPGRGLAMLWAVLGVTGLQLAALFAPFLKGLFQIQRLSWAELAVCAGSGCAVFMAVELEKRLTARRWLRS